MRVNDHVQSVLVSKKYYKVADVPVVVKALGYNCFYIDDKGDYYRVRQFNPDLRKNARYKTIPSTRATGVEYVIQY